MMRVLVIKKGKKRKMAFSNGGLFEVDVNKICSEVISETDGAND